MLLPIALGDYKYYTDGGFLFTSQTQCTFVPHPFTTIW